MLGRTIGMALLLSVSTGETAGSQELRIGFVATLSGSGGTLGQVQLNGFRLGLAHEGWNKDGDSLSGVPTRLFISDDQQKPDVGLREVQRLIQGERVHVLAGFTFSGVLAAVQKAIIDAERPMISSLAAASVMAGPSCSVFFTSMSPQTAQWGETIGKLATDDGAKRIFAMAPNYQAGKDIVGGFKRFYSGGSIVGETLFKLGQTDFQAEISRVRASNADAVMIFAPGAMGISFIKQWKASGAGTAIRVYATGTFDELTVAAVGSSAVGSVFATVWNRSANDAANRRFIKSYVAKFGSLPTFYAAQSYDSVRLLAAALKKLGGKTDDALALARAIRRAPFASLKEGFAFNVNGMAIQPWYRAEVAKAPGGKAEIRISNVVVKNLKDAYWQNCPQAHRY